MTKIAVEPLPYKEKLREVGRLQEGKAQGDLIDVCKYLMGRSQEDGARPLSGSKREDKRQGVQIKLEANLLKREEKLFHS